jgi:hypothetical protein
MLFLCPDLPLSDYALYFVMTRLILQNYLGPYAKIIILFNNNSKLQ